MKDKKKDKSGLIWEVKKFYRLYRRYNRRWRIVEQEMGEEFHSC